MTIVLERDRFGRELLWQCAECGKAFNLGWGDYCNACVAAQERHKELIAALEERRRRMNRPACDKCGSSTCCGGCQYLLGLLERAIDWLEFSTPEEYSNARQQREFIEELRKAIKTHRS